MLGLAVYRVSVRDTSLVTGEVGSDATTAPYVGGGYTRAGRHVFVNLGIYLGPSVKTHTQTSVSSEDDSGGFDVQAQIGVKF